MPKRTGTRKERAENVVNMLVRGPHFSDPTMYGLPPLTTDEAVVQYKRWSRSWILEELALLSPEIRDALRSHGFEYR
jgi:hypothetical protein